MTTAATRIREIAELEGFEVEILDNAGNPEIIGDRPRFPCKPCPSHEGQGFFHKGLADVQGLYGRNHKGVIAIAKPDPALVAVLINREHSRLSSQVKTLEKVLHALFSCI